MADMNLALASSVDLEAVRKNNDRIENLSDVVRSMVKAFVNEACGELDSYMSQIDDELEDFTLNLPSLLYFTASRREELRIKEDVAKAVYKEVFNRVREKAQGTVADKDTAADLAAQAEAISVIVLQRAGSSIKSKEEAAWEMLNSVKKVLSMRIAEIDLTKQSGV